ncbi:MAG: tRNA lysidine(34) synthetase TilS [Holosporales bacterium]|nr:tRNA lysidine(34) synthetase TilS [Holosporales bacterium]
MIISDSLFAATLPDTARLAKRWVVAVSGGSDSLCLTLLANEYAMVHDVILFACFVDHGLRPNSREEIEDVIKALSQFSSINTKVLVWEHSGDIDGSIELKARNARYNLLTKFCQENGIDVLMTAHHALDQWETFFMRLSRGSALRGLSCIKPISERSGVKIIRPLLNFAPCDLKETLGSRFGNIGYKHDPMNDQMKFERVRWRKAYQEIASKYGLDTKNVNKTIFRLQMANDCLDQIASHKVSEIYDGQYIQLKPFKDLHIELRMRILGIILRVGHLISYDLLLRTADQVCRTDFVATNLAGYIIRRDRTKNLRIEKENRDH